MSLSLQQLEADGFYAYVFPRDFVIQSGWKGEVRMYSFDYHCGKSSDVLWNPITVNYSNSSGEDIRIDISPPNTYPFYDDRAISREITLAVEWIPNQAGEYYVGQSGGTTMRFTDRFGMEIAIISSLPPSELALLLSELEYVGPDVASVSNPWVDVCQ